MGTYQSGDGVHNDEEVIVIANEFAHIRIRKVRTRNGERLEISAPRRGTQILLDALDLESLTWQTPEVFSKFLSASVGDDGQDEPSWHEELSDLLMDAPQV
jgi:hypothetical protein